MLNKSKYKVFFTKFFSKAQINSITELLLDEKNSFIFNPFIHFWLKSKSFFYCTEILPFLVTIFQPTKPTIIENIMRKVDKKLFLTPIKPKLTVTPPKKKL